MSEEIVVDNSMLSKLKRLWKEQLWLVILLAPLLIVAILVGQNFQKDKRSATVTTVKKSVVAKTVAAAAGAAGVMAEISSRDVAMIVAKPISELLVMEVYFSLQRKAGSSTRVSSLNKVDYINNAAYNRLLTSVYTQGALVDAATAMGIDGNNVKKVKEHS